MLKILRNFVRESIEGNKLERYRKFLGLWLEDYLLD